MSACFQDKRVFFSDSFVEFNETVTRTPALGANYPIIALRSGQGTVSTQVNLVGAQRPEAQAIRVSVEGQATTAREGVHYRLINGGVVTIPANNSFGNFQFEVLPASIAAGQNITLVFVLEGNQQIKPSNNYARIGFRINP
ncbi:MAG: hypothetical protein RMJ87_03335 [Cytophagales bacterium]|nr:DUF4843 domain-containing protein [Bernardetiaceae bacterium]MDW8204041.1 hypothetical protein [Cytophagales bacterium]